jgi:hypothetical protein
LTIEPGRKILANLADLRFDEVIIVQQPFGGRGDGAAFADRRPDRTIGGEQNGSRCLSIAHRVCGVPSGGA